MENKIQKILNNQSKKALSSNELLELIDGKADIVRYRDIIKYDDLDHLLGENQCVIILYEIKEHYGHWVCLFKRNNKKVEFFDSYGLKPDSQLEFIPKSFKKKYYPSFPILTLFLFLSGYQVIYNEYQLQKDPNDYSNEEIRTCGRHVALRIILRQIPLKKYLKFIGNKPDLLVTFLTL